MDTKNKGFNTKLVHAGDYEDMYGSAVTPIYQASTFKFKNAQHGADSFAGRADGYIYTRIGNPTIDALENKLAELENGYRGIALASGMAAVSTVYMALLGQGKHIVSTNAVYGPSRGILERDFSRFGVEYSFVDTTDLQAIEKAFRPNTALLYIETPTNPTIEITDIAKACEIAKKHAVPVCVDNTFCSPYTQRPLDLGADIVLHSVTKFINGHADIVGGAIIAKDPEMYKRLRQTMIYLGGNMDPHQAYMTSRGVKTLALRMNRSQESAMKIAQYLENHPKIDWVKYPGLTSHPQHELAKKQMSGFGTMMSFEVKGGLEAGKTVMDNVHLCMLAVSLGGVETLIQHPASMTHAGMSQQAREEAGITNGLVRFSVGIEDAEDIIADLDNALKLI
ncbi:MAG: aminotransferase class I/II-fold pyridoxal phosphate-dependent enzyme [Bacteroidales bacterium]|jgi:methionine-gamma-lyase|nr:aminotransferase class I/II-fold pyridoxal phosphate-dependent enzyme [Bacteroidales bacterium]